MNVKKRLLALLAMVMLACTVLIPTSNANAASAVIVYGSWTTTIGYGVPARHQGQISYNLGNLGKGVPNWVTETCVSSPQNCIIAGQNWAAVHTTRTVSGEVLPNDNVCFRQAGTPLHTYTCFDPPDIF